MGQLRINLFAGPGAGKSTTAHWIMWKLKSNGLVAEYSREWIKRHAYAGTIIEQCVILNKQANEEVSALETGGIVVTDSPILMQAAYATLTEDRETAIAIASDFSKAYPTLNIFIERGDRPYIKEGRWQTHEEAKVKDDEILTLLDSTNTPYIKLRYDDYDGIWNIIEPLCVFKGGSIVPPNYQE